MPGYKDWIEAVDIKVDYFSAFMKAWIAFNAWYNYSGEISGNTDKDRIEYIGSKSNRFKAYIENHLVMEDTDGKSFRENLAGLHSALLSAAITTQEYVGVRQAVSFSEVAVKNANSREDITFRSVKYLCTRAHGKITTTVTTTKNGTEIFRYEQDEYNIEELKLQSSFQKLTGERQTKCITCYEKLTPYVVSSVIAEGDQKIEIGVYSFVNDVGRISQAIITILYMLRCCLAHGDVSPDEKANNVYRYAYEVLVAPLRNLK